MNRPPHHRQRSPCQQSIQPELALSQATGEPGTAAAAKEVAKARFAMTVEASDAGALAELLCELALICKSSRNRKTSTVYDQPEPNL